MKDALDEFVMKWVEEDIHCLLGNNPDALPDATMQTLLEGTGQKLRVLVERVAELALHFVSLE